MRNSTFCREGVVWASLVFALSSAHLYALDPYRPVSQYNREHWGPERGFPNGAVSAITQTQDGYLWIATETGLVRFDGLSFNAVTAPESTGLLIEHVLDLLPDRDGSLWLRLAVPTLVHYQNGEFAVVSPDLQNRDPMVTAMARSQSGGPLVTSRVGGVSAFLGREFHSIATAADLPKEAVASIAEMANGEIWLGTSEAGLIRLQNQRISTVVTKLAGRKIQCLLPEPNGQLWVGTDRGLLKWDGITIVAPAITSSLRQESVTALARDRDSNIWVGTATRGLIRLNANGTSSFHESLDGTHQPVTAVFEDREGDVWAGGPSGIERIRESAFITYGESEGLSPNGDGAIHADSQNCIWWAPNGGGLYRIRDGKVDEVGEAGSTGDVIYSISGNATELWLGRQKGGLSRLRFENGVLKSDIYSRRDGLASGVILVAEQNRDTTVWIGSLNAGVSLLQGDKFRHYSTTNGLAANTVTSILEASDGTTWFAGPEGVSSFASGSWKVYGTAEGLPSKVVNSIFQDSAGVIWLGTLRGIAYFRSGRISVPAHLPAPLQAQIFGLAEDHNGSLWVTSSENVIRVARKKLLSGVLAEGEAREYGFGDGLRGVATTRRHRSIVADRKGRIWLSSSHGLSMVDPSRLAGYSASTIVHVESILVDGSNLELRSPLRIASGSRRVAIRFVGLNLSAPDRVRFRYALDGNDRGWNGPVSVREAVYTNLPPGQYRFRVTASNADGVWNGKETVVAFAVDPSFWQTWWFELSAAITLALSIYVLYRVRLEQMSVRVNIRFEERLAERTRMARELHDTLLQTIQGSRLLAESAMSLPGGELAHRPRITAVLKQLIHWLDQPQMRDAPR